MLESTSHKYLDFVKFPKLYNWSVQYLNDSKIQFNKKYPLVRIGEFLTRNKTTVAIQDESIYQRITIRIRNGGVVPRDEVKGSDIGTKKQYIVSAGQFILSKIDARNGAMGIIPESLNGAIVTQDFLAYDIDESRINPQYLVLVSTTKQFIDFCQSCSSGTTNRQRVDEAQFLNIEIPLPTLDEQEELVAMYNKQITLATDAEAAIAAKRCDINSVLFDKLGIEITKNRSLKKLFIVSFSALQRWDYAYLQNHTELKSSYPSTKLKDCIEYFMKSTDGKSLRVETYKIPSEEFRYIGMEHIEKSSGELIDIPVVKGEQIKSQTIAIPQGYFIYGKLRPYLNKYWYNNTNLNNIVCSSELFVFKIKDGINTRYFELVLGSDIVQRQIADLVSGARMPRINEVIFKDIRIPLPPIGIQNSITTRIDKIKSEIKELQQKGIKLRKSATSDFETRIFE